MTQPAFQLNDVRVAVPCPVLWEDMAGDEHVRFCNHWHLNVYNFAELSKKEAEALFSTGKSVSGRLYRRSDGTLLTKDCSVGLRALRKRASRRAAAAFATLLGLGSAIFGQSTSQKDPKSSCTPQVRITRTKPTPDSQVNILSGTVVDPNGGAIPAAKVLITNTASGQISSFTVGDDGKFSFASLADGNYSLSVEAKFFKPLKIKDLLVEKSIVQTIDLTLELSGDVVVVGLLDSGPSIIDKTPGSFTISGDLLIRLPH
jgi:hypothetical protein